MNVITHAFAPVAVALAVDVARIYGGRQPIFPARRLVAIGCAGALPDLLYPHLSLVARYSSWTHTVWFLLAAYPVFALICRKWFGERSVLMTQILWLAAATHLATDMVSNGIRPLYPYGPVIGYRLIRGGIYRWLRYDMGVIATTVFLGTWARRLQTMRGENTGSGDKSRNPLALKREERNWPAKPQGNDL